MGGTSIWHWVIVLVIVMLLFGRGRVSALLGDLGSGIGLFRREMADEDSDERTKSPSAD